MIHIKNCNIDEYFTDIDDYPESLDSEYEPDLDERYLDERVCHVCGHRLGKRVNKYDWWGSTFSETYYECPNECE